MESELVYLFFEFVKVRFSKRLQPWTATKAPRAPASSWIVPRTQHRQQANDSGQYIAGITMSGINDDEQSSRLSMYTIIAGAGGITAPPATSGGGGGGGGGAAAAAGGAAPGDVAAKVKAQGDIVRQLKKDGASKEEITAAVNVPVQILHSLYAHFSTRAAAAASDAHACCVCIRAASTGSRR